MKAGVLEVIQKPFDIGQIRKAVERALEKGIMPQRTFYFPMGIAFDIPVEWVMSGFLCTEAHFRVRDELGTYRGILSLLVLNPGSNTLGLALDEVRRGAWGARIRNVEPVRLGELEALRMGLTPGEGDPVVAWLVISPSGRAVGFIPHSDPALVEGVLTTLRTVPIRKRRK